MKAILVPRWTDRNPQAGAVGFFFQQNIAGFDVAMDDAVTGVPGIVEGFGERFDQAAALRIHQLVLSTEFGEVFPERPAGEQLSDDVNPAGGKVVAAGCQADIEDGAE
jgi:hypothetical protein